MPLYSSGEEDDDEYEEETDDDQANDDHVDGPLGSLVNHHTADNGDDDDEDDDGEHDLQIQSQQADLTKPLVDSDSESQEQSNYVRVRRFGRHACLSVGSDESSIGTASDLQNFSDDDDDDGSMDDERSSDDSDSDGELATSSDEELPEPIVDSSDNDFEMINFDHDTNAPRPCGTGDPLTSLPSKSTEGTTTLKHQLALAQNISRIQITGNYSNMDSDNTSMSINDGTSIGEVMSTCSVNTSSSQKNIDNIDHLVGHLEAKRPLLEEDEDDECEDHGNEEQAEASVVVGSLLELDTDDKSLPGHSIMHHSMNEISNHVQVQSTSSMSQSLHDEDVLMFNNHSLTYSNNFEASSLQQVADEIEENLKLDDEVAQSLNCQVLLDQMSNMDLFGSTPFTDRELIVSVQRCRFFVLMFYLGQTNGKSG